MRIIGGRFRSRRLSTPKGQQVRPSSGALREAVFNMLGPRIDGARVLDLFAGSGAIGLEALSRGATHATFVDNGRHSLRCIKNNIASLEVDDRTRIINSDAISAANRMTTSGQQFDIIFVDPPYHTRDREGPSLSQQVITIVDQGLLAPDGILLVEEGADVTLSDKGLEKLQLVDHRRYGTSHLYSYRPRRD